MAFNPDAYLKSLEQAPVDTFDPDAYLKSLEPPKAEESSFIRRALGDTAVGLGQGVVSAGQAAVGIADIPTFGAAGKALSAIGYDPQRTNQILQELKSPEEQAIEKKIAETKGFLPTAKEIITHPTALLDFGLQSAPSMVGGAGIARKILTTADKMLAKKLGLSLEEYATKKAAETAASTVAAEAATQRAILAGAAGEGAVSAGSTAEQIREQNPSGYLTPAQVAISTVSGALTGTLGVFGGKLANKLGIGDIDTILAGGARTAAQTAVKKNIFLKAAEGALSESVFEELPQSMQEQISQNLATGKPWDQGVAEAGAQGAMAAIGMGGIGGGVSQYSANKQIEKNAQAQPAIETPAVPLIEAQAGTVPPVVTPAGVPPVVNPVLTDADVEDLQAEQPVAPVTPTPVAPVATAPTATPIPQAVQPTAIPAVPPVAVDAARIQELKNSIAEGEMIAKSGKKTDGTKMSKGELSAVIRSIENAKIKLNELESVNAPVATAPTPTPAVQPQEPVAQQPKQPMAMPEGFEQYETTNPDGTITSGARRIPTATPVESAKPDDGLVKSGEQLKTINGRIITVPPLKLEGSRQTANTIKRLNEWTYSEAVKETAGNSYQQTLLKAIDPKKMSQADQDTVTSLLFGDVQVGVNNRITAPSPVAAPVEPLHTVVNNETKMEASVYPKDNGTFNVAQKDLESGETLDTFKNFKTQEEAIKYAETIQTPVAPKPAETAAPAVTPTEVVAPTPVEAPVITPVEKPKTQAQKNQERQQEKKINAIDAKAIPLDAYYNGILTAMANSNKSEMPDVYGDDAPKAIEILKNNNLVAEDKDGKLSLLPAGQSLLTDIRNYNPKNSQEAVSTQDALFAKHIKQLQVPTTPVAPKAELNTAKEWNDSIKVLQDISDFPNVKYEDLEPSLQKRIAEVHSVDGKLGPKNMAQFTPEIEKHLTVKANKDRIAEQKRKAKNKSNTLLTKLIDLGGVSTKDKRDVTGEKQSFPPGYARAFRTDAKTSLRGHIERGDLDEFLPNNMRLSANTMAQGAFDSEPAYDYLSNLIKNGKSVTPYIEAEKQATEFERYAGTETMLSDSEGDVLDDLVKWATEGGIDIEAIRQSLVGENNAQKERNLLRMLQEARDEEQSNAEPIETTEGPAGPDIKTGIQETAGEFKLTGQTEAEIKADEVKAKADAEAKAKEEAQAEQKRKAEKETFTLTGSDRETDKATAAGVKGLFDKTELEADFERIKNSTVKFSSGLTAISDLTSGAQTVRDNKLSGIGIDIGQLSANGLKVLAEKILGGAKVFVDSGAFSVFKSNLKNNEDRSLNFDAIIEKYNAITEAIAEINVHDDDYPSPMIVMPDIIGNQKASIDLAQKYAKYIKAEADFNSTIPIVPLQKGELTLAEAYRKLVDIIGTDNFVVGLPSNAEAISKKDIIDFLEEVKPANVHFLGAAAERTLTPLLHIVAKVSPNTKVTADASQIRSKILSNVRKGMNRKQAINAALNDYSDPQWKEVFKDYGIDEFYFDKVEAKIVSGIKSGLDELKAINAAIDMYAPKKEASKDKTETKTQDDEEAAYEALQEQAETEIDEGPIGQALLKIEDGDFETKAQVRSFINKLEKDGILDDVEDAREGLSDREQTAEDVLDTVRGLLDDARDDAVQERVDELESEQRITAPTKDEEVAEEVARSFTSYDEGERKVAEDTAKRFGGEIVWQDGDLALIRGYGILNGKPVYVFSKDGTTPRVDIESYTGSHINLTQLNNLIAIKTKLEAEANKKHKETPFVKFDDGIAMSKDIPAEVAGITKEWKKMLGIKANIYVSSIEDAKENRNNFTGPMRAIGAGTLNANERGSMLKLPDGSYFVLFTKSTSKTRMLETIAHELGHVHEKEVYESQTMDVKFAIKQQYDQWLQSNKGKTAREHIVGMRSKTTAQTTVIGESFKESKELPAYWSRFSEWYADQTARWAISSEKPVSVVDTYFARLGKALRKFYNTLKGQGFLPNETFKKYLDGIAERTEALQEQTETEEVKEKPFTEVNKPSKIEDFGEKIFVKKDAFANFKNKVDESKEVDIETSPLSKSWVEPDYQKLLDEGMSPFGVAFLHSTRDAVPTKPKATWKLRSWVKKVNTLRDLSYGFIDGNITEEQIKEIINKEDEYSNYNYLKNRIDLYLAAGHEKSLKGYELSKHSWTYYKGMKYDPPGVILWDVISANGTRISESEDREEAIAKFVTAINKPKAEIEKAEIKFGVWSRRGKEGFFIGKKIGKNVIYLKMLPTVKEARDYILNNHDELVAQFEKYKEIPSERGEINQARVGADHRMGANVSQEQFFDTFGFRSTIFGNTVNNARRQQDLNNAYDALMDLAGVLEIPPKALSMNGEIGLLFGADGRGGKNPASAHYSNSKLAINLTKTNGAGSLAHELFHALDNYFSRMGGDKYKMLTETQKASANVRPEVVAAFKDLMTAISATSIKERSKNLDKRRTKEYWSTGLEMAARAFESYVINKLKDQNASNDYLANIVSEKEFNIEDGYPYPTAAEIPAIRAAFDNFFNVLETKETDKGVMLYNIDTKTQTKTPAFKKWFGNSKIVDANGNPLVVYHGSNAEFTEFDNGTLGSGDRGVQSSQLGHFFTVSNQEAKSYGSNVVSSFLSIKNPYITSFESIREKDGFDFKQELISKGYDGVILKDKGEPDQYIAFNPNQIKSATGNRGTFDETSNILQNQQFVKNGIAYESEEDYRSRQIQELRVASMKVGKAVKHIADYGSNLPLQRKLNQLLEREASLKDYLESTKPENNSDADFMARATKELAAGNISEEVEAVIRQIYEKYPGVLSGLKLSVKQNKYLTSSAAGAFNPYARIVSLYKNTSGVEDESTVRHEIVHSLEQMMTPQAAQAVVNAWARAFEKAMKKNIDPASKAYFDAVLEFLASPSKELFEKATNLMPSYNFYQYLNPSEYWAVNAESMLQAKLGTPWHRFVLGVKRLIEGLKSVLGFDNTYVVHNALNNLLKTTPQRLSKTSLVDYVVRGKVKIDFLNNIDDERRLMDNLGVPNVPSHIPKTLREKIGETHKSTEELVGEIKRGPNNVLKAAGSAVGDAITEARIQAINFNAGLERADAKKYAGKIRDANNNMLPSIAVKNATHANSVYNAVLHQGKMRYDETLGAFTAYDSDESLKNIVELQHKLRKKTGVELGDKVINSWFAAKRTKGIQDSYLNLMDDIRFYQEELLTENDPEVIAQLTADLNAAQHWLDALEAALINVPSFLIQKDADNPTKVVNGKTIPNILYDMDGMPVLDDEAMHEIIALEDKYPELKEMMKNWKGVSHNMIDNMAFSSRISQKEADGLKEIKDYSPWQRIRDEEEEGLFGNRSTGATSGIARFKKTRTELPLENVIENMTNQVKRMVNSSLTSFAYNRIAMEYAVRKDQVIDKKTGLPKVDKTTGLPAKGKIKVFPKEREGRSSEGVIFPIYVNGNRIHIQIEDSQIADALLGLAMGPVNVPFQAALSGFSNLVRRSITFSGYFQTKQVFYDAPTAAWVSGVKSPFKVWVKSFSTYAKALGSIVTGVDAPTIKILKAAGVGGYHTFHRESLAEEQTTLEAISGKGFARFKRMVDRIGDASDYAQRGAIYDQVLAETGDPSLALLKASDIVDWNKRGLHDAAQGLRQTVPFLGAYAIQLDALSQAAIAGGTISSAKAGKEVTRRQALMQFYLKTGLGMALLVAAYTLAAGSDDDYWKLDDDTRARNFYVPGSKKAFGNPILIPMHSTAALFWKVIPESMLSYVLSQGTKNEIDASRARSALWRATKDSVLGPMPIPAAIKTPAEIAINYDFFTGTNVVPQSLAKLDASEQYNYNTSELGKALSVATTIPFTGNKDKQGNRQGGKRVLNPIEADHLIRGWLGSVGSISEWVSNQLFGEYRPASELRSNPLVGGIVGPETSRRNEALFYDLKDKTEPAYNTYIKLIKENKASEVKNFYDANRNLIEAYGYTSKMDSKLQELNSYMKFVGKIEDKSWTKDKKLAEILRMQALKSDILEGTLYFRKRAGL